MTLFTDLIKKRQSTRKFSGKPINKDDLIKCIEAARLAPSASNSQPWKFIVVDDPELRKQVAKHTYENVWLFNRFTANAPCMIVVTIEKQSLLTRIATRIKDINWELIDIGIASQHLCLQAEELDLGTCMIGWFNEEPIKKLLKIPSTKRIGLLIALGYPVEGYRIREKIRKSIDTVLSYNSY
ncbi:MAG: nitroreductase family protein [Bacteroidales bacterium]|nr:nitroreductase family protein [Bacteroidales bacterium]